MLESDSQKRNWLGTIVFTDIVGYSKCPVDQQITIKDHFNGLIGDAIANTDESERVVIDTGDGIALCFLGDPEEAIISTMELRAELVSQSQSAPVPYEVRTGINLGPVRLVTDINGRFNVLGDGINVAQRVMSFAGPSQVLVSRAFYDVAWCLSDEYSSLFQYFGLRKDKHEREHILYEVVVREPGEAVTQAPEPQPEVEEYTRVIRSRLESDTAPLAQADWEPEVLRQIENDLMDYIGPLAKVVVRKEAARALSIEDLHVRIAKAMPAGEKRKAYMETIAARQHEPISAQTAPPGVSLETQAAGVDPSEEFIELAPEAPWTPEWLEQLQQALAEHVGPLAAMLVRKAARRARDKQDLCTRLANEIGDLNDREAFIRSLGKR